MNTRQRLQAKTRSPDFLWKMVLGILVFGLIAGYVLESSLLGKADSLQEAKWNSGLVDELEELAESGAWAELWWKVPRLMTIRFQYRGPLLLATLTGICWLAFVLQALQLKGWADPKLWLTLAAVLLGILSIWPTFFFIFWQEFGWGLVESASLIPGLRYFILGVGLREEFAKLLCLLPLMPFLLRLRSELAALLVCAAVGLGFAIEENIGYFFKESGTSVVGRYVTANPFHMTLTGLVGLAVYRGLRSPRDWGPHALATFGTVVFAHGLYDAFIVLPTFNDYGILTVIVFALVVYQFFHELRELRPRGTDTISLTANFLCGVSLVTASTFVYLSASLNWTAALDTMVPEVLSMALMVYLFLREMPESMVSV